MDEKANYKQLVLNLARLAVDLALQNDYYRRQMGRIAGFRELPDTVKRLREFQPPLHRLEAAADDQESATALDSVLAAIARFLL